MPNPQDKPPREVRGVTEADYQRWRHNPVSQWFLAYLKDYRADLLTAAQEQWLAGQLVLSTEHEMKGRALCLAEVADLPFEAVANFYDAVDNETQDQNEDDDGSEAAEDDAGGVR